MNGGKMVDIFSRMFLFAQVFSYSSLSPVNAFSGVISPTTLSLIASPVATPRTTPRSTPIPRWTTPFGLPLDDNMDYNSMLANMMHVNPDESLMNEGRFLRTDACVIDIGLDKKSIQLPFLITALRIHVHWTESFRGHS